MLKENNIDFDRLKSYLKSDNFLKEAGAVVDDKNNNYKVLKSNINGKGIFAEKQFKKGDFIGYVKVNGTRTFIGRYTNHSDINNGKFYFFKNNDNSVLIAEKTIRKGDEIVVNYRHHFFSKDYYTDNAP